MSEKFTLPDNFDGTYKFTNWTDTEFVGKWNNVAYKFPPMKSTTMIMADCSPRDIQYIRKKFAKELAEQEFFKTQKMRNLEGSTPIGSANSFQTALTYNLNDLEPLIQRCLEPMPVGKLEAEVLPNDAQTKTFRTDEENNPVSQVIAHDSKKSLIGNGTPI